MGTVDDNENRNGSNSNQKNSDVFSCDAATQKIDSQFSPGGALEYDRDDNFLTMMNRMPFDDNYLVKDEFETQMVNLDEETQMANLVGETQVMDVDGETQMLDLYEETQVVDLPGETQLLDEFNAELDAAEFIQTTKTDVACETQRLSEDESDKIDGGVSVELESPMDKNPPKGESPCRGFVSIRTASIRASGLAARAQAASRSLSATSNEKSSLEQQISELDDRKSHQEFHENDRSGENESNSNKRKSGCTAVRKLFVEDQDAEIDVSETENNEKDDNLEMPETPENSLAGLSYVNSQEPGELSQARALEVVDKILDLSFLDDDEGFGKKVKNFEKPRVVSAVKGSRDLAKKSTLLNTVGERGIYDWDDAHDGGWAEFSLKKKELFFDTEGLKQRSLTEPRKPKSKLGDSRKEKRCTKAILGDLVNSDSGLLHKPKSKQKLLHGEEVLQKNITKNLEEQLREVPGPELSDKSDTPVMGNIGPDTQLAAEAMEDLCFEVHLDERNNSGNKGVYSTEKAATQKKLRNRTVHPEEHLPYSTSVGVITRQAKRTKRITTRNNSGSSLPPNQCQITKNTDDGVLEKAEQRRMAAENVFTSHGTESTGQRSGKSDMKDKLDFSVPVAHRTRKSTNLSCPKVPDNGRKRTGARDKNAVTMTIEDVRKVGLARLKQSNRKCLDKSTTSDIKVVGDGQEKRSTHEASAETRHSERLKRSSEDAASLPVNVDKDVSNHSSPYSGSDSNSRKVVSRKTVSTRNSRNDAAPCGTSSTTCASPATRTPQKHDASPICMGDEYLKQSCRKNLSAKSLIREIDDLCTRSPSGEMRESRKRKDITTVRVLFSQHLDVDIVKQQKKILAKLGGAVASTMVDATHFVADEFVRTRNMLEAIASGKPVVTHLWIESCGQASCLIDEKSHILRDTKKEKEFGFCLPVSLARASQHPLLEGLKVFITPNTKPGKDILSSLVKAVHGLPIERVGRAVFKDEQLLDDLLILSCEEDYDACVPFLEKGGAIYSSELLLNGIVKQKLEYERHHLFHDQVMRTRSTLWLKKTNKFLPVRK